LSVAWKGLRGSRLISGYGRSHIALGRLTSTAGVPISGAQVAVLARPSYGGAAATTLAPVTTAADGRFSLRVPTSASSRALVFSYRAHVGDAVAAATASLALVVRAGVTLAVTPHISTVGHSIFFTGRLAGGPYPTSGKLLVLEARSVGRPWIKFDVIRSARTGRFRASYRFRFPGPAHYSFRVLSESEGDYPYAPGVSNTVYVRER
jgi:hypothetical protein